MLPLCTPRRWIRFAVPCSSPSDCSISWKMMMMKRSKKKKKKKSQNLVWCFVVVAEVPHRPCYSACLYVCARCVCTVYSIIWQKVFLHPSFCPYILFWADVTELLLLQCEFVCVCVRVCVSLYIHNTRTVYNSKYIKMEAALHPWAMATSWLAIARLKKEKLELELERNLQSSSSNC